MKIKSGLLLVLLLIISLALLGCSNIPDNSITPIPVSSPTPQATSTPEPEVVYYEIDFEWQGKYGDYFSIKTEFTNGRIMINEQYIDAEIQYIDNFLIFSKDDMFGPCEIFDVIIELLDDDGNFTEKCILNGLLDYAFDSTSFNPTKEDISDVRYLNVGYLNNLEHMDIMKNLLWVKFSTCGYDMISISKMKELRYLYTKSGMDLYYIKDLEKLEHLDIQYSPPNVGNLSNLKNLSNLNYLVLERGGYDYTGSLEQLSGLTNLEVLWISSQLVTGNISDLSELNRLKRLELYTKQVGGNLDAFEQMKALNILEIYSNEMNGDINSLSKLPYLEKVYLNMPNIKGDLSALSNLYNLQYVYLNTEYINGTITSLSGLINISELVLNSTNISGELESLSKLKNLVYLNLDNCFISGDIIVLSGLVKLTEVTLSGSGYIGNIECLTSLIELEYLNLYNCSNIEGDIGRISDMGSIWNVDIVNCDKIYGKFEYRES